MKGVAASSCGRCLFALASLFGIYECGRLSVDAVAGQRRPDHVAPVGDGRVREVGDPVGSQALRLVCARLIAPTAAGSELTIGPEPYRDQAREELWDAGDCGLAPTTTGYWSGWPGIGSGKFGTPWLRMQSAKFTDCA
jgi:hypothetical protein